MPEIATRTTAGVYRIEDLVGLVSQGRLRVPEFQRNFRWDRRDVLSLFDSIQKGYPVGSLLLWRRRAEAAEVSLGELHIEAPEVTEAMWVVDGQQRITAIANAVTQQAYDASERFRIDFDLSKRAFVLGGGEDDLRVPLPTLFDLRQLLEWAQARPDASEYIGEINNVAVRLRDFSVPASIVDESDEETLREIFDRTNNAGRKLRRAEVFHALFSERSDDGMTIQAIADDLANTGFGTIDGDTVLHAILARRHADFSRDLRQEFAEERGASLDVASDESREEAFQGGHEALRRAIAFLQERAGVPHITLLPYKYLLVTLARFFAHFPDPLERNSDLLVRWFWRAALAPTIFSGSATAMGRGFASRVNPQSESGSVQELLALVPDDFLFIKPNVNQFRTNTAATKVMLCAMYEHGPRRFSDGEVIEPLSLAESLDGAETAHGIISDVVPRGRIQAPVLAAGVGGRFILTEEDVAVEEARTVLARTASLFIDADMIASSHFVSGGASLALLERRFDDFLVLRRDAIAASVTKFLEARMGLNLPANAPLAEYDLDDLDDLDDPGFDVG
ncbi:DUF262 domain-containing protein [Agromyces mediolanus]|uniref:GmrSD restriction endonucleases N-terminal domain-containing protein n=1 Tax=Agromyces mediolanus TaxID=41986 RepID=A0A918FG18_AGRME|nr:DUF262 domain-containing protein [Agromyces mediolanus]GGR35627.1 hypothetical protein GCM10010196_32030 [Agromyces mediolanus]GLJ73034.1 hypothetical protein GCM10017583_22900 [Agromyces mediolanus]